MMLIFLRLRATLIVFAISPSPICTLSSSHFGFSSLPFRQPLMRLRELRFLHAAAIIDAIARLYFI
jgi:hypothetical protein